jgi:hypothetical protein
MGYLIPGQGSVNSYAWIPNDGPLTVSFGGTQAVNALYLPKVDTNITFEADGVPFYTAIPPNSESNPQTVNVPIGTTAVTLTATGSGTYYVFSYTGSFRPSMEGPAK